VRRNANVAGMYEFSLPTKANKVPTGSHWIHEIKHDGYRMLVVRDQDRVRLVSRGGVDFWAKYFPLVVAAALSPPRSIGTGRFLLICDD
jgi:bifunctional non-homologous end joining protein LigD